MNNNRLYQKEGARSHIYQKTTHREHQKLRENSKQRKTMESTNPLFSRDYREIKKRPHNRS